jgi:hypothetical protein
MSSEVVTPDPDTAQLPVPSVVLRVRGPASADDVAAVWAALKAHRLSVTEGPLAAWRRGRLATLTRAARRPSQPPHPYTTSR